MEMIKMSMDIPKPLRARLRAEAGKHDRPMAKELRSVLERAFGLELSPDGESYVEAESRVEAEREA